MEKRESKSTSTEKKRERTVYLSPLELAEMLKVRPGTIYSWLSRGIDIPFLKISGTLRFPETSVMRWLEEQERARKKKKFEL